MTKPTGRHCGAFTRRRSIPEGLPMLGLAVLFAACSQGTDQIYLAAQDYQITPSDIHLSMNRPARLIIRNEGRERHELVSPLLSSSVTLLPGQSFDLRVQAPPGVYEIRCVIKGHTGMRGMVIVEE